MYAFVYVEVYIHPLTANFIGHVASVGSGVLFPQFFVAENQHGAGNIPHSPY